jgi:hypothetical protein
MCSKLDGHHLRDRPLFVSAITPTGTAPRSLCLQDGPGGHRVEAALGTLRSRRGAGSPSIEGMRVRELKA